MKHLPLLALVLLPALGVAQDRELPDHRIQQAWQQFQREQGAQWTASWNPATGTPTAIWGTGIRLQAGSITTMRSARELADTVLTRYQDLLGRGASTFVETIAAKPGQVYVLVYDQRYRGLEVVGGGARVFIHDIGVLSMFGSEAVQIPAGFGVMPATSAEAARAVAHDHLKVEPKQVPGIAPPAVDLLIWADVTGEMPAGPRLAWRVPVDERDGRLVVGKVFVDAATGKVIEFQDEVYYCAIGHSHVAGEPPHGHGDEVPAGTASAPAAPRVDLSGNVKSWLQLGLGPTKPLSNVPLRNFRVTAAGVGSAFTDQNGDFVIPYSGTNAVNLTVNFASGSGMHVAGGISPQQGTAVTQTVPATPGTPLNIQLLSASAPDFDWSQPTVFYMIDDANVWVRSIVGSVSGMNTISNVRATVNRAATCNAFYSGNSVNFYAAGGSCNMTGYDTVVYHEWGHGLDDAFGGITQTDGLSEGWGDIIAIYRSGQPIVGHDFRTNGGIVRTALNSLTYPQPSSAGVHTQGQTWMGWSWDLRNNLISALGQSAGIARAEAIVIGSVVANARNQPAAVRAVFVLDDDDGNLANGTPNYASLEAACLKRNLPYPKIQLGVLTHTPLQATQDVLAPRVVRTTLQTLMGSFTGLELVYTVNALPGRRSMVPSGQPNEFIALLPGAPASATVAYHLEAKHSTGAIVSLPEQGDFVYTIGDFYFDSFDGATSPWTHGLVATQDDWQRGTPTGASGASGGVAWRDPSSAFSAPSCWGNDLAPSGFNGSYQPNVENFLRSPTLNMTGKTGVTLSFVRWLTVEDGSLDQATISVNGQPVWQNPTGSHTIDVGWTQQFIRLPMADNNPAVTLEFRLKSNASVNLGGWNIDDVRLYDPSATGPAVEYRWSPEQVNIGSQSAVSINGTANALCAILLSAQPGPTTVPGLPPLAVGPSFIGLAAVLDSSGNLAINYTAPNLAAIVGRLTYSQVVEVTNATTLTASNKMVILFAQ